jgi:signal peptidase II
LKKVALITFLIILLDQAIKIYVKSTMTIGQHGFSFWILDTEFAENPGMAFGTILPFKYGKITLSLLRIVAITAIIVYIKKLLTKKAPLGLLIAVSCVLAGAIGNILDGAFYGLIFSESNYFNVAEFLPDAGGYQSFMMGSVVDMIKFDINLPEWFPFWGGKHAFPFIFNIADASITVGVATILIWHRKHFRTEESKEVIPTSEEE